MNLPPTLSSKLSAFCLVFILLILSSCKEDNPPPDILDPTDHSYVVDINSPSENSHYSVGDTLPISITFSSQTGEIVHYIRADIYSKTDENLVLYSVESHQHVPTFFEYNDRFVLKDTTKIGLSTDWVLEASMWSYDADADTVSNILELGITD